MIGPSRVRRRLGEGHPVIGPTVNFNSPWFVDLSRAIGFDYVMLDAEHGPLNPESAEMMIRAAEQAGICPLVRVPANVPHEILRFLDIGAVGIQIPHVESRDEAAAAASAMRYAPRGNRGLAGTTRASDYGLTMALAEYMELANQEVLCMPMIETAAGVAAIDEIATTDGVDVLVIGPSDLSQSMGFRGDRNVAAVQKAIDHVINRAKSHRKWVSLPAADSASAREAIARGADFVMVSPAAWLVKAGREFMAGATGGRA